MPRMRFDDKKELPKGECMKRKGRCAVRKSVRKLLPMMLLALPGSAAWAFEPIKFDDGTELDISLQVNYQNLKRLGDPVRMQDYRTQPSHPQGATVMASWPLKGTMWPTAVDVFTQMESKLNTDDGQLVTNKHGTISNRISGLLDVNLKKDNYRVFARVNAYRDAEIFQKNDNWSQGTFNGVGPSNEYSQTAKDLAGQRTRLLDFYAQGRWKLGDDGGYPLFLRVGRQVVNWGEGLFFQGIGSSMNPNDQIKGMTPGIPAQEAFLPTEQIYGTLGITDKLTVMAYKKWRFRETEMAPVGTYFSASDFLGPGAEFEYALPYAGLNDWVQQNLGFLVGNINPAWISNYGAWRGEDIGRTAKGQYGIAAKYQYSDTLDLGVYHLKYTETVGFPQFNFGPDYWKLGSGKVSYIAGAPNYNPNAAILEYTINALTPFNSMFQQRYMNNIKLYGASFSTMFGDWQVAGEGAYRNGAPLMINNLHYNLARAKTLSGNMSFLRTWSGTNFLWGKTGADNIVLGGELAYQHLLSYETPPASMNPWLLKKNVPAGDALPRFDKNALAYVARLQMDYTPWPEWDLTIPIFYWHQLIGNGAVQGGWNSGLTGKGSSRATVETKFTYRQNLELALSLNYWLGDYDLRNHSMNNYADRDLLAINAAYRF
jgi:hypothetical protein